LSFSSAFRSRHQSLYLSSMVGYSNPEIQICKSAKDTRGSTLVVGEGRQIRLSAHESGPKNTTYLWQGLLGTTRLGYK
jgi:hypothetical protein